MCTLFSFSKKTFWRKNIAEEKEEDIWRIFIVQALCSDVHALFHLTDCVTEL